MYELPLSDQNSSLNVVSVEVVCLFSSTWHLLYILTCIIIQQKHFDQQEEFEDTKEVIRIRISKKNRQHNDQKKKYKRTNNDLQNIHIKLKIE